MFKLFILLIVLPFLILLFSINILNENSSNIMQKLSLFEGLDLRNYTPKEIMDSKKVYDYICEAYDISLKENIPMEDLLDEGIFSAIIGGAVSSTVGVSIMKAICKCLGIDEKGTLGNLLTSRLVLSAMGTQLGYNW